MRGSGFVFSHLYAQDRVLEGEEQEDRPWSGDRAPEREPQRLGVQECQPAQKARESRVLSAGDIGLRVEEVDAALDDPMQRLGDEQTPQREQSRVR